MENVADDDQQEENGKAQLDLEHDEEDNYEKVRDHYQEHQLGAEVSFYGNLEPELAGDQVDHQHYGTPEILSNFNLNWDPNFNCFFCNTCSTYVIKDNTYYDVSVLYDHVSSHHQVVRKEEMRAWLNEFQNSDFYVKFEPMKFYHGMEIIPQVEVIVKALKCGRCKYFGDEEDELSKHHADTHHGGLVCRRLEG